MGGVEQLTNLRQGSLNLALQRGNPQTLLGGAQGLSGLFLQAMGGVYRKVSGLSRSLAGSCKQLFHRLIHRVSSPSAL